MEEVVRDTETSVKCSKAFSRSLKYFDSGQEMETTTLIKTFLSHLHLTVCINPSAFSHFPDQLC